MNRMERSGRVISDRGSPCRWASWGSSTNWLMRCSLSEYLSINWLRATTGWKAQIGGSNVKEDLVGSLGTSTNWQLTKDWWVHEYKELSQSSPKEVLLQRSPMFNWLNVEEVLVGPVHLSRSRRGYSCWIRRSSYYSSAHKDSWKLWVIWIQHSPQERVKL